MATNTASYTYKYTYINDYGQESAAGAPVSVTINWNTYEAPPSVRLTHPKVNGAASYRYYKQWDNGEFGHIGDNSSSTLGAFTFFDPQGNLSPNLSITPPEASGGGRLQVSIHVDSSSGTSHQNVDFSYVFTYVNAEGAESLPGGEWTGKGKNLRYAGDHALIYIPAMDGATEYKLYKMYAGSYGYIGSVLPENRGKPFMDENITPNAALGPPRDQQFFSQPGHYPGEVSIYQQRLVFASSYMEPQKIWMSKAGHMESFATHLPLVDDDPIEIEIASNEISMPVWLVPLRSLIIGAGSGIWEISSREQVFTPTSLSALPQLNRGCAAVRPVVVGNRIIYVMRSGKHVFDLVYDFGSDGYADNERSIMAPVLFEGRSVVSMYYQPAPYSMIWLLMSDGNLLSFTYQSEHEVYAWAEHQTQGKFMDLCVLPGPGQDMIYALVERQGAYFLEKMTEVFGEQTVEQGFFLDCGLSYKGEPVSAVGGLSHLEGREVAILADGQVHSPRVVKNGGITLDSKYRHVHVGLAYAAELETLPLQFFEGGASTVGMKKKIHAVTTMFFKTVGCRLGSGSGRMVEIKQRSREPYNAPIQPANFTHFQSVDAARQDQQSLIYLADKPLPCSILGVAIDFTFNR
jgi:hypothetical protein